MSAMDATPPLAPPKPLPAAGPVAGPATGPDENGPATAPPPAPGACENIAAAELCVGSARAWTADGAAGKEDPKGSAAWAGNMASGTLPKRSAAAAGALVASAGALGGTAAGAAEGVGWDGSAPPNRSAAAGATLAPAPAPAPAACKADRVITTLAGGGAVSAAGLQGDWWKGAPTAGPGAPKAPPGTESKGEAPDTMVARPWKVRGAALGAGAGGRLPKRPAVGGACTGSTFLSLGLTGAGIGTGAGTGAAKGMLAAGSGAATGAVATSGAGTPRVTSRSPPSLGLLVSKSPSSTSSKSLMDLRR